uniref:Putative secreted protein n=1 Tax=Anopheles marajoara TaxID=58244 RepID=A0A2M4CES4_9DIPT
MLMMIPMILSLSLSLALRWQRSPKTNAGRIRKIELPPFRSPLLAQGLFHRVFLVRSPNEIPTYSHAAH